MKPKREAFLPILEAVHTVRNKLRSWTTVQKEALYFSQFTTFFSEEYVKFAVTFSANFVHTRDVTITYRGEQANMNSIIDGKWFC